MTEIKNDLSENDLSKHLNMQTQLNKIETNMLELEIQKNNFEKHIECKITILENKIVYINYKFKTIKKKFKKYSISIIYLATILTLLEAFINIVNLEVIKYEILIQLIRYIPLIISSIISLLASIIKFNKYDDKIENITRDTEKCIETIGKMKGTKEEIYICKELKILDELKIKFSLEIFILYLESNTNIDKHLMASDYVKIKKQINYNNAQINKTNLRSLKIHNISKKNESIIVNINDN